MKEPIEAGPDVATDAEELSDQFVEAAINATVEAISMGYGPWESGVQQAS